VVKRTYTPERGDLVWLSFSPQAGHEQAGRRPALVLSPIQYNRKIGLALVCPVTNRAKGYPFEVALPVGLPITGVVLADHLKSQDWYARTAEFIARVDNVTVTEILGLVRTLLTESP
jgi:mRNA interferase MazF